jgi:hypothetical protein
VWQLSVVSHADWKYAAAMLWLRSGYAAAGGALHLGDIIQHTWANPKGRPGSAPIGNSLFGEGGSKLCMALSSRIWWSLGNSGPNSIQC